MVVERTEVETRRGKRRTPNDHLLISSSEWETEVPSPLLSSPLITSAVEKRRASSSLMNDEIGGREHHSLPVPS